MNHAVHFFGLSILLCGLGVPVSRSAERSREAAWPELPVAGAEVYRRDTEVVLDVRDRPKSNRIELPRMNHLVFDVRVEEGAPEVGTPTLRQDPKIWTIELPEGVSYPARVVLELSAPPTYSTEPYITRPSGDGALALSARHAIVYGEKLQFEPQPHKNTVGYWVNPDDWAEWQIEAPAGDYRVRILQGCGAGQGGSRVAVVIPGDDPQRVEFTVQDTGHFQNFVWRELGTLQLADGRQSVSLRVVQLAKNAVMDVRQIRLEPVTPPRQPPYQLADVAADLIPPPLTRGPAKPGRRVRQTVSGFNSDRIDHALYLPTDYRADERFPLIVEATGNGYTVADAKLGFGISGGHGYLWLTLPYLDDAGSTAVAQWWGTPPRYDVSKTLAYWRTAIAQVIADQQADPERVVLVGFSRGALAANYLGLHDEQIAKIWRAFVCFSHYDGIRESWPYPDSDRQAAAGRLLRLGSRPQFICSEASDQPSLQLESIRSYLAEHHPRGHFTFRSTGFLDHDDAWVLRPSDCRQALRVWLADVLKP